MDGSIRLPRLVSRLAFGVDLFYKYRKKQFFRK